MMDYSRHYGKWHDHHRPGYIEQSLERYQKLLKSILPDHKHARILEIGCANGMALLAIRELGYTDILGVEISPELSTIAKSFGLNIVEADALDYVQEDIGQFDLIFMIDVLEHIDKDKTFEFLQNLYRILNPDGKLFLIVPNAISPAASYYRYIDWTHETSFTPTSIQYLLENAGFTEIHISEQDMQQEPDPEHYGRAEWYEEALKNYNRRKSYLDFIRWQASIFFGREAGHFPFTPNMQVIAVKGSADSVQLTTTVEETPGNDYYEEYIRQATRLAELERRGDHLALLDDQLKEAMEEIVRLRAAEHKVHQLMRQMDALKRILPRLTARGKLRSRLCLYPWRRIIVKSNLFDVDYYLESNPDVRQAGADPIKHYLLHGAAEGRNPNRDFNTIEYIFQTPEIIMTGENPFIHYIKKIGR